MPSVEIQLLIEGGEETGQRLLGDEVDDPGGYCDVGVTHEGHLDVTPIRTEVRQGEASLHSV